MLVFQSSSRKELKDKITSRNINTIQKNHDKNNEGDKIKDEYILIIWGAENKKRDFPPS